MEVDFTAFTLPCRRLEPGQHKQCGKGRCLATCAKRLKAKQQGTQGVTQSQGLGWEISIINGHSHLRLGRHDMK